MSFASLTDLVARTMRRLRQVSGASAQLYSEDVIADYLSETYEAVRSQRWWDHLMQFALYDLDGVTGQITTPIIGLREGYRDVQSIRYGNSSTALPIVTSADNPLRWNGTTPRAVEPMFISNSGFDNAPFRIWPLTATTDDQNKLLIRYRADPVGVFDEPTTVIPFDASCLVNGAAMRYAADDGTTTTTVALLDRNFTDRLQQLQQQHDSAIIVKDERIQATWPTTWEPYP